MQAWTPGHMSALMAACLTGGVTHRHRLHRHHYHRRNHRRKHYHHYHHRARDHLSLCLKS